jgi:hypothetical protein
MRMHRIILSYVACSALLYFSTLSHKRHELKKKLLNTNCVSGFHLQLLPETFLILRRTEQDMIKNVHWSSRKIPIILSHFNETWIFATDFRKILRISDLKKIRPVGSELFHVARRTDKNDEFNSPFSQFCERAQNGLWPNTDLERQRTKTKLLLWWSHALRSSAEERRKNSIPSRSVGCTVPQGRLHVMAKTKFVSLPETERAPSFSSPYLSYLRHLSPSMCHKHKMWQPVQYRDFLPTEVRFATSVKIESRSVVNTNTISWTYIKILPYNP